jgi:hypothetical protein
MFIFLKLIYEEKLKTKYKNYSLNQNTQSLWKNGDNSIWALKLYFVFHV